MHDTEKVLMNGTLTWLVVVIRQLDNISFQAQHE